MKFAVKNLRLAEIDALEAAAWYDEQEPGMGDAFFDDLDEAIAALSDNPLIYSVRFADVRCIRLSRFRSYGVFYVVVDNEVRVLAIHHGSRHPRRLQQRHQQSDKLSYKKLEP